MRLVSILALLFLSTQALASNVRVGIFDISFFGIEDILPHQLSSDYHITKHDLYSPHGAAVASLIANQDYGGSANTEIALMSTGIYTEDFEKGLQLAIEMNIKIVNISLHLRHEGIAELINEAALNHGILFVVSAGNDAIRSGRKLKPYYHTLEAIIVSCLDFDGTLPDFAQLDPSVTALASCGRSNIPTLIKDPYLGIRQHQFGMTSAAAPQVTAWMVDRLAENPDLNLNDFKRLFHEHAPFTFEHEGIDYPIISR